MRVNRRFDSVHRLFDCNIIVRFRAVWRMEIRRRYRNARSIIGVHGTIDGGRVRRHRRRYQFGCVRFLPTGLRSLCPLLLSYFVRYPRATSIASLLTATTACQSRPASRIRISCTIYSSAFDFVDQFVVRLHAIAAMQLKPEHVPTGFRM